MRRSYRVADGRLQGCVLLLLAADVVEGEEDVVVVSQRGRQLDLDLVMEIWGPGGERQHEHLKDEKKEV